MRNRRAFMTILASGGASDPFAGYAYYANSVTGSDSNPGTSSLAPFATIAKLLTVWQAGQSVGLAKGSTWREELLYPGNSSAVYAYGASGNKPILDASDIIPNASWTKTGGRTNVYEFAVVLPARSGEVSFTNCWENDVNLALVADVATCDATAGSYYIAAHEGAQTLYIHAPGSTDPIANGKTYTYSKRHTAAMAFDYTGCTISGVRTQKNHSESGSLKMGQESAIINPDCYYGSKHNCYMRHGSNVTGGTFAEAYYTSGATLLVLNDDTPAGENSTISGATFVISTAYSANYGGFTCHKNTSGAFGTVTFDDCTFDNLNAAVSFLDIAAAAVTNCDFDDCTECVRTSTAVVHTVTGCTCTGTARGTLIGTAVVGATANVTSCTVNTSSATRGISIIHNNTTLTVTNSSITGTGYTATVGAILVNTGVTGAVVTVNGTTLNVNAGNNYRFLAAPTYVGNNNTFILTGAPELSIRNGASTYTTIADWRTASSQDANSVVA
jgi:hypothetical protein